MAPGVEVALVDAGMALGGGEAVAFANGRSVVVAIPSEDAPVGVQPADDAKTASARRSNRLRDKASRLYQTAMQGSRLQKYLPLQSPMCILCMEHPKHSNPRSSAII